MKPRVVKGTAYGSQPDRPGDPDRGCRFDAAYIGATFEDDRAAQEANPLEQALQRPADRGAS